MCAVKIISRSQIRLKSLQRGVFIYLFQSNDCFLLEICFIFFLYIYFQDRARCAAFGSVQNLFKMHFKNRSFHGSQPSMAGCHSLLVRSLSSLQLTGLDDSVTDPGTVQNPLHSSSPSSTPFILGGAAALQVLVPTQVATAEQNCW